MPDLNFEIVGAESVAHAVSPLLILKTRITNAEPDTPVKNVLLRCQVQIETVKRQYSANEKEKLFELYGEPERWGQTLRTLLWTHTSVTVPAFSESIVIDLPVPCTFDFNVATTKYFDGLEEGDIPLCLLFSGTIFFQDADGSLQIDQVSWEKEATYRLPVAVWKQMMDHYYPNSAWLNVRKDVFDRLRDYKMQLATPTWEKAFEKLLAESEERREVRNRTSAAKVGGRAPHNIV